MTTAPTNTYDSLAELALGNVPSDINTEEGLYRELLDIHNAIDGLVTFTGTDTTDSAQYISQVAAQVARANALLVKLKTENDELEQNISIVAAENALLRARFNTHNNSITEHGVLGINVGTGNFADEFGLLAGVVHRTVNLPDAANPTGTVTQADPANAPPAYSQTNMQATIDLAKANKVGINTTISEYDTFIDDKFNALLALMITALQMSGP